MKIVGSLFNSTITFLFKRNELLAADLAIADNPVVTAAPIWNQCFGLTRLNASSLPASAQHGPVQPTARDAHDRDYQIVVVEDACAAASEEEQEASMESLG